MKYLFPTLLAFLSSFSVLSQTQSPAQPIELPEFIVTGKEQVGVPGAVKQQPLRPPILSSASLDSLNPTDKLPLPTMKSTPFPQYSDKHRLFAGWLEAYLGNYLTPKVGAGYSFRAGNYLVDLGGLFEASTGWTAGSDYMIGKLEAHSSYVAPDEFFVFGGSETRVDVNLDTKSYSLYARDAHPTRSRTMMDGSVTTQGKWESLTFNGSVGANIRSLSDSSMNSYGNRDVTASLQIMHRQGEYGIGGVTDLRLSQFKNNSYPFAMFGVSGETTVNDMDISATIGPQYAGTTFGLYRSGVQVHGSVQWHKLPTITADLLLNSGLRNMSVSHTIAMNPYIADSATLDASYDVFDISGTVRYHPVTGLTAEGRVGIRRTERDLVWTRSDVGVFVPSWLTTSTVVLQGSVRWLATTADVVNADVTITNNTTGNSRTPYVAPITVSANYNKEWTDRLSSSVTGVFVGERYADLANKRTLDSYLDLQMAVSYTIGTSMSLTLRAENLVGSTMVIWEGYRERGVFVSGGLSWRF